MTSLNFKNLTLPSVGEHLEDAGHKFEESEVALIATEDSNFRRRIC